MAFTRQLYGSCATKKQTEESTSAFSYIMDPNKYYNCQPCRVSFGVTGGNNVSLYEGNMVDLESDLSGRTRVASGCPSGKYLPGTVVQSVDHNNCSPDCGVDGLPCGNSKCRQEKLVHLPECELIHYKPRPQTVGYELNFPTCPTMGHTPKPLPKPKRSSVRKNLYSPVEWQGQQGVGNY